MRFFPRSVFSVLKFAACFGLIALFVAVWPALAGNAELVLSHSIVEYFYYGDTGRAELDDWASIVCRSKGSDSQHYLAVRRNKGATRDLDSITLRVIPHVKARMNGVQQESLVKKLNQERSEFKNIEMLEDQLFEMPHLQGFTIRYKLEAVERVENVLLSFVERVLEVLGEDYHFDLEVVDQLKLDLNRKVTLETALIHLNSYLERRLIVFEPADKHAAKIKKMAAQLSISDQEIFYLKLFSKSLDLWRTSKHLSFELFLASARPGTVSLQDALKYLDFNLTRREIEIESFERATGKMEELGDLLPLSEQDVYFWILAEKSVEMGREKKPLGFELFLISSHRFFLNPTWFESSKEPIRSGKGSLVWNLLRKLGGETLGDATPSLSESLTDLE